MKKMLILLSLNFSLYAQTPNYDCKEIIAKALLLNQISLKNIDLVKGNLVKEANIIETWARQIDRATQNHYQISTKGMKENARQLKSQSLTLEEFKNSMQAEMNILIENALECN
jgi:hypothetical protein